MRQSAWGAAQPPKTDSYAISTTPSATGGRFCLNRPSKFFTTLLMKAHTPHGNVTKTAIGYLRVSAQEQATEGVSLDAQRDRLRSYCKLNGIRLIDIISDECSAASCGIHAAGGRKPPRADPTSSALRGFLVPGWWAGS